MMGHLYRALPTASQRCIVLVELFSVTLVSIPVVSKGTTTHIFILVPFILCIGWSLARIRSKTDIFVVSVVGLYGLTIAIEVFRGYTRLSQAVDDTLLIFTLIIFGVTLMASAQDNAERELRIGAMALAPAVYIAVNLLMVVGHIKPTGAAAPSEQAIAAGGSASLLRLLGVAAHRAQFPLASGVNTFGAVAASGFAAATILAVYNNAFPRRLTVPLAAVSLYGALASDSRTAILISLVVIAVTVLAPRLRTANKATVLLCLSPFLLVAFVETLGSSNLFSTLARNSSGEATTLNGRYFIWQGAWRVAGKLNWHTLVGWGANGQITSGASFNYAYIFRAFPEPTKYTTHNIMLQTILDGGYLSLVVFLVAILVVTRHLDHSIRNAPRTALAALRASLFVVLFAGITEALPDYNSYECLSLVLIAFGATAAVAAPAGSKCLATMRARRSTSARVPSMPASRQEDSPKQSLTA
jgi:hypothetical protein